MNANQDWRARNADDQPPVLFRYIVHYTDGQTVDVPVLYGRGAAHWIHGGQGRRSPWVTTGGARPS